MPHQGTLTVEIWQIHTSHSYLNIKAEAHSSELKHTVNSLYDCQISVQSQYIILHAFGL